MFMDPNMDPADPATVFILLHELVHMWQGENGRISQGEDLSHSEAEAYILTYTVFNAWTGGRFLDFVSAHYVIPELHGQEPSGSAEGGVLIAPGGPPPEVVMMLYGTPTTDMPGIIFIRDALIFEINYRMRVRPGMTSPEMLDLISGLYRRTNAMGEGSGEEFKIVE
jgi:hypothetical protein